MYAYLSYGDRLPTVAIAQISINPAMQNGTYIKIDGVYGPNTRKAVYEFQGDQNLTPDGIVGENTWNTLTRSENFQIVDTVDITEPDDVGFEDKAIRSAGGSPLTFHGMCFGVWEVMPAIQAQDRTGNKIGLLRFHGHGTRGAMGLTVGKQIRSHSSFTTRSRHKDYLERLTTYLSGFRNIFSNLSSVELHGCRVAAGTKGRRLIIELADAWDVPVTAGLHTQWGGGTSTFRFEGPAFTAFHGNWTLKKWAESLTASETRGMSVSR